MSRVYHRFAILLVVMIGGIALVGCQFPTELFFAPDSPPPSQIETPQPTATISATSLPDDNLTPTLTIPPCAYAQAEQPLPEVTARVQDRLNGMGLGSVEALAVAYGENCVDTLNNKILSFTVIETDFFFTTVVTDSQNKDALGNLALRLLTVTKQFPPGEVPGPNMGYMTIVFQDGNNDARLRVRMEDAIRARDDGLTGEQFYSAVGGT